MSLQDKNVLELLIGIKSLQSFLKSEMQIEEDNDGKIKIQIKVSNTAPSNSSGIEVVFTGVGLRIIDGRERPSEKIPNVIKVKSSENTKLRRKYNEGVWTAGRGESFPAVTADEQSHGEVLFPGECVEYEIKTSKEVLPYLEIRFEGSVSRRHLLHFSKPMEELKQWRQPLIIETFRAVEKIDFFTPLVVLAKAIPEIGPQTTFAGIENLKTEIEKGRRHLKEALAEVNKVYPSVPNQRLRDYINEITRQYLKSAGMAFDVAQKALSTGDVEKIKEAVDEMKRKLLETEQIKHHRAEIITEFEIEP